MSSRTAAKTTLGSATSPEEAHEIGRYLPADVDGLRHLFRETVESCSRDTNLMRASSRWAPGQPDVLEVVTVHAAAPILVSQAAPYFVPAPVAIAAAGSDCPPADLVDDCRLPFEVVWVVFDHDLELPEGMAWPPGTSFDIPDLVREVAGPAIGHWRWNIVGALHERGGALNGVVLFAGEEGIGLADEIIWTVSANPDPAMPYPQNLDSQRGIVPGRRSRSTLALIVDNLAPARRDDELAGHAA